MSNYRKTEKTLYSYPSICVSIKNMEQELAEIGAAHQITLTAVDYAKVMVDSCGGAGFVEGYVLEFEREREDLIKRIEKAKSIMQKIDRSLGVLPDKERQVIEMRYFEGLSWDEVATKTAYTDRHCRRLKRLAIDKILIAMYGI